MQRSQERGEGRGARVSLDYAVRHVYRVHRRGAAETLKTCCGDGHYQRLTDYRACPKGIVKFCEGVERAGAALEDALGKAV